MYSSYPTIKSYQCFLIGAVHWWCPNRLTVLYTIDDTRVKRLDKLFVILIDLVGMTWLVVTGG